MPGAKLQPLKFQSSSNFACTTAKNSVRYFWLCNLCKGNFGREGSVSPGVTAFSLAFSSVLEGGCYQVTDLSVKMSSLEGGIALHFIPGLHACKCTHSPYH